MRIGLTGGIGSGKSTVALLLKEHGATVIDADAIARELVEAHGGEIELVSSGPEGTVFRLSIPDSAVS